MKMKYDPKQKKPPSDKRILVYGPGWSGAAIAVYSEGETMYGSYLVQPFLMPFFSTNHVTAWEELPFFTGEQTNISQILLDEYKRLLEDAGYIVRLTDPRLPRITEAYDTGYIFEGNGRPFETVMPTFEEAKRIVQDESLQCMHVSEFLQWRREQS